MLKTCTARSHSSASRRRKKYGMIRARFTDAGTMRRYEPEPALASPPPAEPWLQVLGSRD
jgi:hypothetical protein